MGVRSDLQIASRISIAGCTSCRCGQITVRLHDSNGDIFASAGMPPETAALFLEMLQHEVAQANSNGLAGIRCEEEA